MSNPDQELDENSENKKHTETDKNQTRIFPDANFKWGATEELNLILGIKEHGFDWDKLSKVLESKSVSQTKFTAEEVFSHFEKVYTEGEMKVVWSPETIKEIGLPSKDVIEVMDYSNHEKEILLCEDQAVTKNVHSSHTDMIEYVPQRGEYNQEYKSYAEDFVMNLHFLESDSEIIKKTKLTLLLHYVNIVKERFLFKKLIAMYQMTQKFFLENQKKIKTQSDKKSRPPEKSPIDDVEKIVTKLLPLARYFSPREFVILCNQVLKEMKLQKQIYGLEELKKELCNTKEPIQKKPRINEKEINSDSDLSSAVSSEDEFQNVTKDDDIPPLSKLPGFDILSEEEKMLCANLGLRPVYYVAYKIYLVLHDSEALQPIKRKLCFPVGLPIDDCKKIIKFLFESKIIKGNWLNTLLLETS